MTDHLQLTIDAGIARLTIDRPLRRNAFDQAMWTAFPTLVDAAMVDPSVRVLIVAAGDDGAFCAGADIAEFAAASRDPAWRRVNQAAIRSTQVTLAHAPKPTIAMIEGDCIGGGCGIALACDMRIAGPRARFGITPAKLGLVYPLHDTRLLVDLVGPAQARRMLYTARLIDAEEAVRIGLIEELSPNPAETVAQIAADILATSPQSQRASKAIIRRILDGAIDDDASSAAQFDAAFVSADFIEGVTAFLGKRPARFGR